MNLSLKIRFALKIPRLVLIFRRFADTCGLINNLEHGPSLGNNGVLALPTLNIRDSPRKSKPETCQGRWRFFWAHFSLPRKSMRCSNLWLGLPGSPQEFLRQRGEKTSIAPSMEGRSPGKTWSCLLVDFLPMRAFRSWHVHFYLVLIITCV